MANEALEPQHDKLRLTRDEHVRLTRPSQQLIESYAPDLPEESKEVLRQVLLTIRVAVEECVSFERDDKPRQPVPSFLSREEVQNVDQDWQQVRELEAAVQEEEAVLLSMRAGLASEVEAGIQMIEQSCSDRAETQRSPLEDVQNTPADEEQEESKAEQELRIQLQQKWSVIQDELRRVQMYARVADVKMGDLAHRRTSLLPPPLQPSGPVA